MDGLELLKNDHRRVDKLFNEIESETVLEKRRSLFQKIRAELDLHCHIEEKVLYPFFSEKEGFKDLVEEAYDEHQEAKSLLLEIDSTRDENTFDNYVGELVKAVRHHVKEEEKEFFPKIRQVLDETEINTLGEKLEEAKQTPIEDTLAA